MKTIITLLPGWLLLALLSNSLGQSTIQFSTNIFNVAENAGSVILSVQRTGDTNAVVTVDYASTNGTATEGLDYTTINGTLIFAAGETNQTIAVTILNDGLVEPAIYETFTVGLSNPTNAVLGTRTSATVRITDNDKGLAFEFANYWAREDEGSVLIAVVRADDGNFPASVDFATSNLAATNGLDYAATNGTLSFAAGEKVKLFTVPILNNGLKEPNETFRVTLSNPTNQVLGSQRTATVTIWDNDPGVQFTRNAHWVYENESTILLTVTRGSDELLGAFTVDYATTNVTAQAGQDYVETLGTLEFAAGEMIKTFSVSVFDDGVAELDEQFKVPLSNPTGGMALGTATNLTATVTLCDTTEMLPHRFDNIHFSPDGVVSLALGGGYTPGVALANRFQPYFDNFPVEVSTNLADWMPLTRVVRTNALTNQLSVLDPAANAFVQRFYRTPATKLITVSLPPTGPYAVGRLDRLLTDPTRRNRYATSTNGSFMLTLWYPATAPVGKLPSPYDDPPIGNDPAWWSGFESLGPHVFSYSFRDAQFAPLMAPCPVVLFSHGLNGLRNDCVDKVENLASHGYVVVAVDHYDCTATVFPDGSYLAGRDGRDFMSHTERGFYDRVADLVLVRDQLEQWNRDDPFLADKLDLEKLGAFGGSWGGPTVAELCRTSSWCKAVVLLDPGAWYGALPQAGLSRPSLTMVRANNASLDVYGSSAKDAIWFQISNTEHFSFGSWYTVDHPGPSHREVERTINAYLLWFMNKYLKGSSDPVPALVDYPRVVGFQQK